MRGSIWMYSEEFILNHSGCGISISFLNCFGTILQNNTICTHGLSSARPKFRILVQSFIRVQYLPFCEKKLTFDNIILEVTISAPVRREFLLSLH